MSALADLMNPNQMHKRMLQTLSAVDSLIGNFPEISDYWPAVARRMAELLTHLNSDGVPLYLRIYAAQVLEGAIQAVQWALESGNEVALRNTLQLARLREDIRQAVTKLEVDLPERPTPELAENDDAYWLFDSRRDYMDQLQHYKARRNGDDADAESAPTND